MAHTNLSQLGLAGIGKEGAHLHERVVQHLTHPGRVCWVHMPQPARGRHNWVRPACKEVSQPDHSRFAVPVVGHERREVMVNCSMSLRVP